MPNISESYKCVVEVQEEMTLFFTHSFTESFIHSTE